MGVPRTKKLVIKNSVSKGKGKKITPSDVDKKNKDVKKVPDPNISKRALDTETTSRVKKAKVHEIPKPKGVKDTKPGKSGKGAEKFEKKDQKPEKSVKNDEKSETGKEGEKQKKAGEKQVEGKERPSAIRKEGAAPPVRRISFKSPPDDGFRTPEPRKQLFDTMSVTSTTTASSTSSPALCVENIDAWKKAAAEEGISLEQYMEKMSAKNLEENLEEHMRSLAAEAAKAAEGKKEEKEEEKEEEKKEEEKEEGSESGESEDEIGSDTAVEVTGKSDAGDQSEEDDGDEHAEGEESENEDPEGEESEGEESDVPIEEFDAKLEKLVETKTGKEKDNKDPKNGKKEVLAAVESHKKRTPDFETANSNLERGYSIRDGMGCYKVSGFVLKFRCGFILPFDRLKST